MDNSPVGVRNAAARRLVSRGRLREALDVLNEAIRLDSRYAESYQNRAEVFEQMGMYPQADADRRKAAALAPQQPGPSPAPPVPDATPLPVPPPPPPETTAATPADAAPEHEPQAPLPAEDELHEAAQPLPIEAPGSPPEDVVEASEAQTQRVPVVPRYPVRRRKSAGGGAAVRALGLTLVTIGLFIAAGAGIYLALDALGDSLGDDNTAPDDGAAPTEPASTGETSEPTPTRNPETPEEALQGDPVSFSQMEAVWSARGIAATTGDANEDLSGFGTTPVDVTLSRDGETMDVAVLLYDSPSAVNEDWDLAQSPAPKPGREVPPGSFVWYNLNAVVVVLEPNDALRGDALDAFLGISA